MKDKLLQKIQRDRAAYWDGDRYIHKDERKTRRVAGWVLTILVFMGLGGLAYGISGHLQYMSAMSWFIAAFVAVQIVFTGLYIYRTFTD